MVKEKIGDISKVSGRITQYYKNFGEQLNYTYNRLAKIEASVNTLCKQLDDLKETSDRDREELRKAVFKQLDDAKETSDRDKEELRKAVFKQLDDLKETSDRDREELREVAGMIETSLKDLVEIGELTRPPPVEDEMFIEEAKVEDEIGIEKN